MIRKFAGLLFVLAFSACSDIPERGLGYFEATASPFSIINGTQFDFENDIVKQTGFHLIFTNAAGTKDTLALSYRYSKWDFEIKHLYLVTGYFGAGLQVNYKRIDQLTDFPGNFPNNSRHYEDLFKFGPCFSLLYLDFGRLFLSTGFDISGTYGKMQPVKLLRSYLDVNDSANSRLNYIPTSIDVYGFGIGVRQTLNFSVSSNFGLVVGVKYDFSSSSSFWFYAPWQNSKYLPGMSGYSDNIWGFFIGIYYNSKHSFLKVW
jgi:hypothetical protein